MARLARLQLTEAETERMQQQLAAIVEHVAELSAVDTNDVSPDVAGSEAVLGERPDVVQPSLTTAQALAQAPESTEDSFCVPAFVEEG